MKKFTIIISLFACIGLFAQNKVGERITELKATKAVFKNFSILTPVADPNDSAINKVVANATFATINFAQVNDIVANKYETIEVEIPYQGAIKVVELYKVDLFNENFHIDTDKATSISYEKGVHYRGLVKGNSNSIVSMNFFHNEMNGVVSDQSVQNLVIGKLDRANNINDYIIYSDSQLKIPSGFNCSVNDASHPVEEHNHDDAGRDIASTRCVTMYFEIDHDLFVANGSDVTATSNWLTSVFNNVQTLYSNDGITIALKSFFIWTTNDPYAGASSFEYLYQFNQVRPVFDGDVGQLVGIDPGGLGGVAVTIEGLCSTDNYSYSDINGISHSTVPTYSWTIMVVTHEFGHLLGSRHTHACVWNGNNTAIDGCQTTEGSCAQGPIPSGTGGTIMSYCHLVGSAGINFNNGFGFQPASAILTAVNGSNCLSTDCVSTCINTISGITVTNLSPTSIDVSWSDIGSTGPWQVAVLTLTSNFPNWQTVTTPNRVFTGLNANSYYKVRIRPVCSAGMTPTFREYIFATSAVWCDNITITDTGGAANNHGNMESYVRTFMPSETNKKIVLTFNAFGLELDYDYLYVYDGADTNAPLLGTFTGTTIPGPFTSTAADGSLTLRFESDPLEVALGYVATVSCENMLGLEDMQAGKDFSYYPNPTNGVVSITSKTEMTDIMVYNVAGQLLYQSKINELDTQVDISSFSSGTYFFKLRFNDIEANFKILKL